MTFLEQWSDEEIEEKFNVYHLELNGEAAIVEAKRVKVPCGSCCVLRADFGAPHQASIGCRLVLQIDGDLQELTVRKMLDLVVDWPFLLDGVIQLRKRFVARILERRGKMLYVQMEKHTIKTFKKIITLQSSASGAGGSGVREIGPRLEGRASFV